MCRQLGACRASFIEGAEIRSAADGSENGNLMVPVMRRDKPTVHLVIVPDGGRIWTEDEVYLSHATAQRTWLAVERAKAHQALQQSEQTALALVDRLKSADRGRNEMIAILSHELRNPMAVMAAALDLFELDSEDGKSKKTIDTIRNQLEQLTKIVDDLRDLARIVGPGLQLAKETIDLRMVVMNVTRGGLDSAFKEKGVELVQSIPFHPIIVKIDPPRVIQSLETVLGHALNFTPANGTVKLILEDGEDSARIEIKDEGPGGLSPGLLDNVFEPFVQAGSAGRRRVTGGAWVLAWQSLKMSLTRITAGWRRIIILRERGLFLSWAYPPLRRIGAVIIKPAV